jgi:hypothetical protein
VEQSVAQADLADWIQDHFKPENIWYLKRLAANDTLASHAHQAGPYIPRQLLFSQFPRIADSSARNPDELVEAIVDSHSQQRVVRAIWYNNRLFGGSRNEARITNWGGISSPLLDPSNTGAVAAFVFRNLGESKQLRVWVCRNVQEEELISERFGPIEPGLPVAWRPDQGRLDLGDQRPTVLTPCWLRPNEIPDSWLTSFPAGQELVDLSILRRPLHGDAMDERLLERRRCEFEIFRSVEAAFEGPRIAEGFESIDEFVSRAQTILQRRKSRAGRSLELHLRQLLVEEGFVEGVTFSHQPESDPGKKPDFLFPSEAAYKDPNFDPSRLRLLASKTTCKDRWRQVINEGDRVGVKHLLTLQEGVSAGQLAEMTASGIKLVVPRPLIPSYPAEIRPELCSLDAFVGEVRALQ